MKKIGVYVDTTNLFYQVSKKYNGARLDYYKYINSLAAMQDCVIYKAMAYGQAPNDSAGSFIRCLEKYGFRTRFESYKANWSTAITVDVLKIINRLDLVVLGTSDISMVPLVEWLNHLGVETMVFACSVGNELKGMCHNSIEITESFLEENSPEQ